MDQELKQTGLSPDKAPKDTFIKRSKDFLQGAVDSITGKDLPMLVEDFSREMTIVAEGLAEDQARLTDAVRLQGEEQDQLSERLRQAEHTLSELDKKVIALQKKLERRREKGPGLSHILRQATWLAGILAAAWVITTLVNTFGR